MRIQPLGLELPGYLRTYESFIKIEDKNRITVERPYYCYLAIDKNQSTAAAQEKKLRDILKKKFPEGTGGWETVSVPTPDGKNMTWKRITGKGDYLFFRYPQARETIKTTKKNYKGTYLLYLYPGPGYHVMIGWHCGDKVVKKIDLEKIAQATAGTLRMDAILDDLDDLDDLH